MIQRRPQSAHMPFNQLTNNTNVLNNSFGGKEQWLKSNHQHVNKVAAARSSSNSRQKPPQLSMNFMQEQQQQQQQPYFMSPPIMNATDGFVRSSKDGGVFQIPNSTPSTNTQYDKSWLNSPQFNPQFQQQQQRRSFNSGNWMMSPFLSEVSSSMHSESVSTSNANTSKKELYLSSLALKSQHHTLVSETQTLKSAIVKSEEQISGYRKRLAELKVLESFAEPQLIEKPKSSESRKRSIDVQQSIQSVKQDIRGVKESIEVTESEMDDVKKQLRNFDEKVLFIEKTSLVSATIQLGEQFDLIDHENTIVILDREGVDVGATLGVKIETMQERQEQLAELQEEQNERAAEILLLRKLVHEVEQKLAGVREAKVDRGILKQKENKEPEPAPTPKEKVRFRQLEDEKANLIRLRQDLQQKMLHMRNMEQDTYDKIQLTASNYQTILDEKKSGSLKLQKQIQSIREQNQQYQDILQSQIKQQQQQSQQQQQQQQQQQDQQQYQ